LREQTTNGVGGGR